MEDKFKQKHEKEKQKAKLKKLKQFKRKNESDNNSIDSEYSIRLGMNFKINPDLIREMTVLFMTSRPFVWVTTTYIIEVAVSFICR